MKIYKFTISVVLIFVMLFCTSSLFAMDEKYPANNEKKFITVDDFYNSLSRNEYSELPNSFFNIRKLALYKDINDVFSKSDQYGESRVNGSGYNPYRQVYIFKSVAKRGDGFIFRTAVFDAETKQPIAKSNN